MRPMFLSLAAAVLLAGGTLTSAKAPQAPVTSSEGLVSAADPRAADAGAQILRAGGNAVDAAIATMLALWTIATTSGRPFISS